MQQQGSKITVQTRGIHPNFQLIQSKDPSMRTAYQFFKGEQELVQQARFRQRKPKVYKAQDSAQHDGRI
jgi:hypothetical protein